MTLELVERETIINFNELEKTASIFTYNKVWQQHLEKNLGLKPIMKNGFGGKEYEIDKKRIPMPRVPRVLSPEARAKAVETLKNARSYKKSLIPASKSAPSPKKMGNHTPRGR